MTTPCCSRESCCEREIVGAGSGICSMYRRILKYSGHRCPQPMMSCPRCHYAGWSAGRPYENYQKPRFSRATRFSKTAVGGNHEMRAIIKNDNFRRTLPTRGDLSHSCSQNSAETFYYCIQYSSVRKPNRRRKSWAPQSATTQDPWREKALTSEAFRAPPFQAHRR